jgi:PAS domain S-box-containing protein
MSDSLPTQHHLVNRVEFYRELLDHLPVMIFYKDKLGIYQYCNDALLTLFGKERSAVIGYSDRQILSTEAAAKSKAQEDLMQKTGEPGVYQLQLLGQHDQKPRDLLVHISLVKSPTGEMLGIAGVMNNISDSLIACIDLSYKISELEKMNKLSVGRELKMIELKRHIKDLQAKNKALYDQTGSKN